MNDCILHSNHIIYATAPFESLTLIQRFENIKKKKLCTQNRDDITLDFVQSIGCRKIFQTFLMQLVPYNAMNLPDFWWSMYF